MAKRKCPTCGFSEIPNHGGTCPKCGAKVRPARPAARPSAPGLARNKAVLIPLAALVILVGGIGFLYATNKEVATEFQQIREPRPNQFFIGVDVSATISTDTLEKLKDAVIERLENFIGDPNVRYTIATFGNPGCADRSFREIVDTASPQDRGDFGWQVEEPIRNIDITKVAPRDTTPLTTPLHHFLEATLPERAGGRVIIFTDLMNDDSDCDQQFIFPEAAVEAFGADKSGQIIFLYPTPHLTENPELNRRIIDKQRAFIDQMKAIANEGKVRAFFYHIPDEPLERLDFLRSQLQRAIPATTFDVVWERTSRMMNTIVSAVRG
jgi:hypothetical protein